MRIVVSGGLWTVSELPNSELLPLMSVWFAVTGVLLAGAVSHSAEGQLRLQLPEPFATAEPTKPVTVPMFDEYSTIWRTVIRSVPRAWESRIVRSRSIPPEVPERDRARFDR